MAGVHNPNDNIWVNITFHHESEKDFRLLDGLVMRLPTPGSVYTDMQNMSVSMVGGVFCIVVALYGGWKFINRTRYLRVFSYEFCGHNIIH